MKAPRALPLLFSFLISPAALAMSYAPMTDAALADQAELVVVGEVVDASPMPGEALDATRYDLRIDAVLKGQLDASRIVVREPGAFDPQLDGALVAPGSPRLQKSERALLFLAPRADGHYEISQMALGAFHARTTVAGEPVFVRDLSEGEAFDSAAKTLRPERLRKADRFAGWLRAHAAGLDASDDYWSNATSADLVDAKFTLYGDQSPRWFEFDSGNGISLYANQHGQAGLSGGGYNEFTTAIRAWNQDAGSNVRYFYAGTTTANGGLNRADNVNSILFNDPNGDIAGSYTCTAGGIIAMTVWRSYGTRDFNGRAFKPIVEVDTVVQDGAGCALSRHGNADAAEVFAHELGHSLGLAHSCGDAGLVVCTVNALLNDALMRPTVHGDGRGAALKSDDLAGVAYLYPNISTSPGNGSSGGGSGSGGDASSGGGGAFDWTALGGLFLAAFVSALVPRRRSAARSNDPRRAAGTSQAPRKA